MTRIGCLAWMAAIVLCSTTGIGAAGEALRYVDDDAPGGGDGRSWDTAYQHLQDALDEALRFENTHEIRIAGGLHRPDRGAFHTADDREETFMLLDDLRIMGGYAGYGAADPDERDIDAYPTILSGAIGGPEDEDNSYHVVTADGVGTGAVLDGVTVEDGNTSVPTAGVEPSGGALIMLESRATVRGCTFRRNDSASSQYKFAGGGAIGIIGGGGVFSDCRFLSNTVRRSGGAVGSLNAHPIFIRCSFRNNQTDISFFGNGGGFSGEGGSAVFIECDFVENLARRGGGLATEFADVLVIHCTFEENEGGPGGARIRNGPAMILGSRFVGNDGGGLSTVGDGSTALIANTMFLDNFASGAAGLVASGTVRLQNCVFDRNLAYSSHGGGLRNFGGSVEAVNCVFTGNEADDDGGAAWVTDSSFANCTFSGNVARFGDGVYLSSGTTSFAGCILWQNEGTFEVNQIYVREGATAIVDYSCVQGLTGDLGGIGNIGVDPMFVDRLGPDGLPGGDDDDLRLRPGSPCIDAADNGALGLCRTDFDGYQRFVDDPDTIDTGSGPPPIADMGALEFNAPPAADCDDDGYDDACAIAEGLVADCNANGEPDECEIARGGVGDCDANGIPDECELVGNDCNENGVLDACDFTSGFAIDCNGNEIPDSCDAAFVARFDCNRSGVLDECEFDCNENGSPDDCDIALGASPDANGNGVPDECENVFNAARARYYRSIDQAIDDAVNGDDLIVNPGEYFETIDFDGKAITLRSAAGPEATIIDGGLAAAVVRCVSGEERDTVLDGFTLRNGNGPAYGGGMLNDGTSPTVRNCRFEDNFAGWDGVEAAGRGAGMANINDAAPLVQDCTFVDNIALLGAGMYCGEGTSPIVERCVFLRNKARRTGNGGGAGGAISCSTCVIELTDCRIEQNECDGTSTGGGGISLFRTTATITGCLFLSNTAARDGGALLSRERASLVSRCRFIGNHADEDGGAVAAERGAMFLDSCLFVANGAGERGAAVRAGIDDGTTLLNCTMIHNAATFGGAVSFGTTATPVLRNCIAWANEPDAIDDELGAAAARVTHSIVEGGYEGLGNLDADPLLADGDGRLADGSPGIDGGDPTTLGDPGLYALDGGPRQLGCRIDIGAHESSDLGADCNANGISDGCDLLDGTAVDCNRNGLPDACDIAAGRSADCNENGIPDECDSATTFVADSGRLAPFWRETPHQFVVPSPPPAAGRVTIDLNGIMDLSQGGPARLFLNGVFLDRLFPNGNSCSGTIVTAQVILNGELFDALVAGGDAVFDIDTNESDCTRSFVGMRIQYPITPPLDCDSDGVPDSCQGDRDTDDDGVLDTCDNCPNLANADQSDCDGDGIGDACAIVEGRSADCNENGIPDECEVARVFDADSGALAPFGSGAPQSFLIAPTHAAETDVELVFRAVADLESSSESVEVDINGNVVGTIFVVGERCADPPDEETIVIEAAAFNALVSGGEALITMRPVGGVDRFDCGLPYIGVRVTYGYTRGDCNGNGVPNDCDCAADVNGDCAAGFDDVLAMLAAWGPCGECPEDADGDGTVGFSDILLVLAQWGPCV